MRFRFLIALMILWAGLAAADEPLRASVERAVARARPALVRIEVVWTEYDAGRELKHEASGSGVIITKDGYIVSNHHVAGHATRLVCILADNEEIEAELVGTDPLSDIAVLRLKPATPREFPAAVFGDSDRVRVGDTVLAMGSPLALSQSVTLGIVSNTKLIMSRFLDRDGRFKLDGEDVGSLVRWIGHDAAIFPGNSGGPLVNLDGEIIGINEISLGLGGAIPGNLAQAVARELIAAGKVRRTWLGIELQPLLKSGSAQIGALVAGVIEESPAHVAGLRSGDVLVALAGRDVNVRYAEEIPLLTQMVSALPVGKPVEVVVLREGNRKAFTLTTAERPPMQPRARALLPWGVTVRNISFLAAKENKLDSTEGAFITSVRPGGPSGEAKPPLQAGDVLREVVGQPVRNVSDLVTITEQITTGKTAPTPTLVAFDRGTERLLTVVKVGLREMEDPGLEAKKAWLPVAVQVITRELAGQLGTNGLTGVRITQVYAGSTAETAGLKVGDLIVALDGEKIPASQPGDEEVFTTMVRQYRVSAKPELTVLRAGQKLAITAELAPAPKLEREMKKYRDENFEFTARDVAFRDRVEERWSEEQAGALVTEVRSGGWAAVGRLAAGDLIVAVDEKPVADVVGLERELRRVARERTKTVVLRVVRGIHTRYLELEPDWDHRALPAGK